MTSLAVLAFIALFGISLIPVYLLRRRKYAPAQEYFIASECTPPGVVQNSSIAYSLQLATFSQFFSWGATGDFWPAIVFSSLFGAGLYLMYSLRVPILKFMSHALDCDRSVTIPGFVAQQHGENARVQLLGAALTVLALSGLVSGVAMGVASLVKPILPVGLNATVPAAFGLLALTMLCTIPGGNSGAMRSAQVQLGILYLGLIGTTLLALYMLISSAAHMPPRGTFAVAILAACCAVVLIYRRSRYIDTSPIGRPVAGDGAHNGSFWARLYRRFSRATNEIIAVLVATTLVIALIGLYAQGFPDVITQSVAALQAETPMSISGLMALVLLPILSPIVDTTNWLRIAALWTDPGMAGRVGAARTPEALVRVLGMNAGVSSIVWLLICTFGTIAVLATGTPGGGSSVLPSFVMRLASQENDVAVVASLMLLASMIALAVLTMSAMFSATLAAIRYDIFPAVWPSLAPEAPSTDQALAEKRAVFAGGGLCFAMLVTLIFLFDYPDDFISERFLSLQFACLCVQLAFSPLVLGPLILGSRAAISPAWAIAVLAAGVAAGEGGVIFGLQPDHKGWLWAAVPACLGSGSSAYAVALLWTSRTVRGT